MNPAIKTRLADAGVGLIAILVGSAVVYLGDRLLNVRLEYYFGVETFTPSWGLDLFLVPFIAGIIVSLIYGLGGKILAHFSPLIVRGIGMYEMHHGLIPPDGVIVLPTAFWILIVIISAEFAAFGGVIGEVIAKKTYGRTSNKALLHKKFQKKDTAKAVKDIVIPPQKRSAEGVDQ